MSRPRARVTNRVHRNPKAKNGASQIPPSPPDRFPSGVLFPGSVTKERTPLLNK